MLRKPFNGVLFKKTVPGRCWICGNDSAPTKEHKIKASDLRRLFGKSKLYVGSIDDETSKLRLAQSTNSKYLKYSSTICDTCNSSLTQAADQAYDRFIGLIDENGPNFFENVFARAPFLENSEGYNSLFRYFAKHLGCKLAEIEAPIPIRISSFVNEATNNNCVWLTCREDPTFSRLNDELGGQEGLKYAAHGGLVIIMEKRQMLPSRIHSSLTIGRSQLIYHFEYNPLEILEMKILHREFVQRCRISATNEMNRPTSDEILNSIGLPRTNEPRQQ